MRPTPLKDEAVAMLHAVRLQRVIRFLIGAVEQVWRGRDIFHARIYKTDANFFVIVSVATKTRCCHDRVALTGYALS